MHQLGEVSLSAPRTDSQLTNYDRNVQDGSSAAILWLVFDAVLTQV
jgi:hypothetical protein